MTRSSRAERMRRLLEDSNDDSSSASSSENRHKPCPFEMPSTTRNDDSRDDGTFEDGNRSEILSQHQQVSDELDQLVPNSESPLNVKVGKKTDQEVTELQFQNKLKASSSTVCCIDADSNPDVIDEWIRAVEEVHATRRAIADLTELPNVQDLVQPWPREMQEVLNSGDAFLPPADIDMSLKEYARTMCSLFGIVDIITGSGKQQRLVYSIHTLMSLYTEYKDREARNDISLTIEEWN
mmetsp:Transcript_25444/g.39950  ORF Transcript_25444/g.39950 Transcript_25444/m.39950 type:complete len:238 (+) Transcript_25444:84-797(+)